MFIIFSNIAPDIIVDLVIKFTCLSRHLNENRFQFYSVYNIEIVLKYNFIVSSHRGKQNLNIVIISGDISGC